MKEILEELKDIWPAGALVLSLIIAYVSARRLASPKNWRNVRHLLWNNLKLSLDVSTTKITTPDAVLLTLGYFRQNVQNHHNDYNSLLLDLYDKCMKYYCFFWWHDQSLYSLLISIIISLPLFNKKPILAAAWVVVYFGITYLTGDKAKEIEKMVTECSKESRDIQTDFLNNADSQYHELS